MLTLTQRVERLERDLLFSKPAAAAAKSPRAPRFTKLCADGTQWMDAQDGDHVAVHDSKTGLTWSAGPLREGANLNHADAAKACVELTLLRKNDWRLPTIEELLSIVDYTRYDPAVDIDYFKGPYGWAWSSTLYKGASGCAWGVNLDYGDSFINGQARQLRVRAVRAGQNLALGI